MQTNDDIKTIQGLKYYTGRHSTIRSLNHQRSRPTEFGHKIWTTTFVLIDFLSANNFNLKNKSILEVGCGWGLLGLFLAKQYNCDVISTDLDKKVLPIAQAHAELNGLNIKTKVNSFSDISDSDLSATQIITGVEVCYSDIAAAELTKLIARAYAFNVEQVFIADPGRPGFLENLCKKEFGFSKKNYKLPGTKNGKTTHLLHLFTSSKN